VSRTARIALAIGIVVAGVVGSAPTALAHEFGPFAIDRYAAILASPDAIELDYVLELAETPTQSDGDRIESDPEAYCAELAGSMTMTLDGQPVDLGTPGATTLRQDGDGGLTTLRVECSWETTIGSADGERTLFYDDDNYRERVGWREIIVVGDRTEISGDVTDTSVTTRATEFPAADENPDVATVEFGFVASDAVGPAELDKTVPGEDDDAGGDAFSDLIADAEGGVWAMVVALGFAAFLGALHSLAPGHGKTVIGAYLVGTKGTKLQALVLAIAVALSHTLGVLVLGIITYAAGARFAPERVYPWLQGVSAVIVLGIGIWLVVTAVRERRARREGREVPHSHQLHAHGGLHDDEYEPADDLAHMHGLPAHSTARVAAATLVAGTAVVAEPELVHARRVDHDHPHPHDHDHDHSHDDDHDHDHPHDHDHDHDHSHANGHDHPHDHDHDHPHDHDHDHSHDDDHDHDHPHDHDHDHSHANGHDHPHDHDHDHPHDHDHDHPHDHDHDHPHDHDHDHDHSHANGHDHPHDHDHDHPHDHDHDHPHDHDHDHGDGWHRHGIFPHTHRYDLDELDLTGKVSWKTLAVLGLSGGLVPSTSAIIVLLGAIQLNRIAFGGVLILAFGLGMAIALVSVGLGMVALRDRAFGAMEGNQIIDTARRVVVPVAAIAVLCIGIFLVIRAYLEIVDL
jgi:ABC-type nickel/cobalt efflux system permease component RcnA